jgi:hypothetical protein
VVCPVFFFSLNAKEFFFCFIFWDFWVSSSTKRRGGGLPLTKLSSNQVTKRQPLLSCIKL